MRVPVSETCTRALVSSSNRQHGLDFNASLLHVSASLWRDGCMWLGSSNGSDRLLHVMNAILCKEAIHAATTPEGSPHSRGMPLRALMHRKCVSGARRLRRRQCGSTWRRALLRWTRAWRGHCTKPLLPPPPSPAAVRLRGGLRAQGPATDQGAQSLSSCAVSLSPVTRYPQTVRWLGSWTGSVRSPLMARSPSSTV